MFNLVFWLSSAVKKEEVIVPCDKIEYCPRCEVLTTV
jgi:hypothetical protein